MDTRRLTLGKRHENAQPADLRDAKDLATAGNIGGGSLVCPGWPLTRPCSGDKRAHINVPRGYDPSEWRSDLFISLKREESIQCGFAGANEISRCDDVLLAGRHIRFGRLGRRGLVIASLTRYRAGLR